MALTFQATMAEEESHTRSRSMETSLRMRLDHGVPLTPKLFGYTHDEDGHLQINPDEAPTVKLIFYMYLYGYSAQQIADTLTNQARSTYFGNHAGHPAASYRSFATSGTAGTFLQEKPSQKTIERTGR